MKPTRWEIGCSGSHYKEWKGIFYPESLPQKDWSKFYAAKFKTIELNVTFYRFPVKHTATAAALKNAVWLENYVRGQLIAG